MVRMNSTPREPVGRRQRALFVTTVPITLTAFLLPLADALASEGWTVDCLSAGSVPGNPVATSAEPSLVEPFRGRFDAPWNRSPLYSALHIAGSLRAVTGAVERGEYDVVHVHTPIAALITRYAIRKMRGGSRSGSVRRPRVLYTAHGFHFFAGQTGLSGRVYRSLERLATRWTDDLITINAEDFEAAGSLTRGTTCRVHLIEGMGIDLSAYDRHRLETAAFAGGTRTRWGLDGRTVVTCIGELNENKRPELVVRAFAHAVASSGDANLHLVLVGSGPLRNRVARLADTLGVAQRTTLTGHLPHPDVAAIASVTDIGVLASQREGLPRSLMELVASGAAVCGTRTRGIADIVGEVSLLAEPSPESLGHALATLATDSALRGATAARQRAHAVEHYSLSVILPRYLALYRD